MSLLGRRDKEQMGDNVVDQLVHPNHPEVKTSWEQITPEVAESYLEANSDNRSKDLNNQAVISGDMNAGAWNDQNPAAIVFDADGRLADGQHRLSGVVETGRTIWMMVVRGVSPDVYLTMDSGKGRTFKDSVQKNGYKNYTTLAALVKGALAYKRSGSLKNIDRKSSHSAYQAFLESDEARLVRLASWSRLITDRKTGLAVDLSAKQVGVLRFALEDAGAKSEDVEFFFDALAGRVDAPQPVQLLKKRLAQMFSSRRTKKARVPAEYKFAIAIKAWNAYIDGQELSQLSWRPGGKRPESFPEIKPATE